jgi:hypothetical protein
MQLLVKTFQTPITKLWGLSTDAIVGAQPHVMVMCEDPVVPWRWRDRSDICKYPDMLFLSELEAIQFALNHRMVVMTSTNVTITSIQDSFDIGPALVKQVDQMFTDGADFDPETVNRMQLRQEMKEKLADLLWDHAVDSITTPSESHQWKGCSVCQEIEELWLRVYGAAVRDQQQEEKIDPAVKLQLRKAVLDLSQTDKKCHYVTKECPDVIGGDNKDVSDSMKNVVHDVGM